MVLILYILSHSKRSEVLCYDLNCTHMEVSTFLLYYYTLYFSMTQIQTSCTLYSFLVYTVRNNFVSKECSYKKIECIPVMQFREFVSIFHDIAVYLQHHMEIRLMSTNMIIVWHRKQTSNS